MEPTALEQIAYISVAQVLQTIGSDDRVLPPGCRGRMSAAIDQLRMVAAPSEHIRLAEGVSLNLHLLDAAVRRRDESAAADLRVGIQALGAQWMVPA